MLREGFTTPDNVPKKDLFFNHVTRSVLKDCHLFFLYAHLYSSSRHFTFYYQLAAQYHHLIHQNLLRSYDPAKYLIEK